MLFIQETIISLLLSSSANQKSTVTAQPIQTPYDCGINIEDT